MDRPLREDVNGENWLFVRSLEMVSEFFLKNHTRKIVKKKNKQGKGGEEMSPIYEQMVLAGCAPCFS